ncbi:hypothetical protein Back11_10060 [Paenibacillus baekrokdamisoli]|uniref:Uncharacterized protein n=1 Tax=Paenibacillus baekrokdamisoli TaxID=1712516 RepID=A0A3G9J1E6_9BACL|nr:DUF2515 family protein [Paenibacillus baekrokdamisoli]MBB3067147.1 hypothetical protein [Paenibacillus baekrokdamisoli]BBH19661.1 hypothetical protein Back11_10060 [Paenibacillus baekrokdamisoli]
MLRNYAYSIIKFIKKGIRSMAKLSHQLVFLWTNKRRAHTASDRLSGDTLPLELRVESVQELAALYASEASSKDVLGVQPTDDLERSLIYRIELETEKGNRNNVTRTEAYRALYFRCPELHWSLLAHVVSRNGGWNMTDLKGELHPRLLPADQREAIFLLLERANALIFQDAYPQLLLYEAGKKARRDLSHLLPAFGVSRFMNPVWSQFVKRGDSALLTTALIVNEQHVIEGRIVQDPYYKEHVLEKFMFKLQAPLQTNAVVMPYGSQMAGDMKLAGLVLEDFTNLQERIEFGKRLYAILFGVREVRDGALSFVRAVHHTGSRADYAPHLFMKQQARMSKQASYKQRLSGCRLMKGAMPLYSPELCGAWKDVPVKAVSGGDWFTDWEEVQPYFKALPLPSVFEITNEHCFILNKIELAVIAGQQLGGTNKKKR